MRRWSGDDEPTIETWGFQRLCLTLGVGALLWVAIITTLLEAFHGR